MKDVYHVARSISNAARLWILSRENEPDKFLTVDPADLVQDRQRRQHPKRIADLVGHCVNQHVQQQESNFVTALTSGNFSGRPLSPPFGSCRSDSHQHSISESTSSNRLRIARAATQTKTGKHKQRASWL